MAQETTKRVNCVGCNKPLRKVKRYYRNGKYYCNKNCYNSFIKKQSKEETKK